MPPCLTEPSSDAVDRLHFGEIVMILLIFGRFRGIGVGTVVMTCVNGPLIGLFGKLLDARFRFVPWLPKLEAAFALEQKNAASAEEGTVKP